MCPSSLFAMEISYPFILFPSSFKRFNMPFTIIYCLTIKQLKRLHQEHLSLYFQAARRLYDVYPNDNNELLFGINFEACGKILQKFQKILHGGLCGD